MTYILTIYETYLDGADHRRSMVEYESEKDATIAFHKQLAKEMDNENCEHILCVILAETGGVVRKENYYGTVEETETEETEV